MKTITLQVLDCDQVIVDELKDAYQRNNQSDSYGEGLHHSYQTGYFSDKHLSTHQQ